MMIALIGRRSATSEKGKRNDERTGEWGRSITCRMHNWLCTGLWGRLTWRLWWWLLWWLVRRLWCRLSWRATGRLLWRLSRWLPGRMWAWLPSGLVAWSHGRLSGGLWRWPHNWLRSWLLSRLIARLTWWSHNWLWTWLTRWSAWWLAWRAHCWLICGLLCGLCWWLSARLTGRCCRNTSTFLILSISVAKKQWTGSCWIRFWGTSGSCCYCYPSRRIQCRTCTIGIQIDCCCRCRGTTFCPNIIFDYIRSTNDRIARWSPRLEIIRCSSYLDKYV